MLVLTTNLIACQVVDTFTIAAQMSKIALVKDEFVLLMPLIPHYLSKSDMLKFHLFSIVTCNWSLKFLSSINKRDTDAKIY